MTFDKFSNIVDHKKNKQSQFKSAWICYEAQKIIDKIYKNSNIEAQSFKNNTLTLKAENQIKAAEIKLKSTEIIKEINQKLKKDIIKNIRTKI